MVPMMSTNHESCLLAKARSSFRARHESTAVPHHLDGSRPFLFIIHPCDAGADMVALTPRHTYNASLGLVLRALAHMRAGGALLHAAEWRMYSKALHSNCICQRMAVVATVSGNSEEASCISAQDPLVCARMRACLSAQRPSVCVLVYLYNCLHRCTSFCLSVCQSPCLLQCNFAEQHQCGCTLTAAMGHLLVLLWKKASQCRFVRFVHHISLYVFRLTSGGTCQPPWPV